MTLTTFFFVTGYFALVVVSVWIIVNRKSFSAGQKRINSYIAFLFPVWGILIRCFPDKPVEGSHFYPGKRNKYSDSPEQGSSNGDGII